MMDRVREGRRTGSGGPVSAPRRPRTTGFKDSPVHDEDEMADEVHNSRLRERIKKDSLVSVVSSGTSLRNKRKRQEVPVPSTVDEPEESSGDTDGAATEDDDDPPPPTIPRWPGKPRPSSTTKEEGIGLDLPAVPRKARSAIVKRHHESPQLPNAAHHSSSPAAANIPSTYNNSSNNNANASKPGRRMKPNGSKPRPAKAPKSSPAPISEQEVEVAEALFDLARMVPSFPKNDAKADSRAESKPDKVSSSPARALSSSAQPGTPLSPPSLNNVTSHPAEAPRRKRPRVRPRSDEATGRVGIVSQSRENEQRNIERKTEPFSRLAVVGAVPSLSAASPASAQGSDPTEAPLKKADATPELKPNLVERKSVNTETATNANSDLNKRKFSSSENRPAKFEIDLMAPPSASLQNDMESSDMDRKENMDVQGGGTAELYWLEERERLKEREEDQREQKLDENDSKKEAEAHIKDEREFLDLNKQGMGGIRATKGPKIDAKNTQKTDRSVSAAVVSAASSFLNATTGTSNTPSARANWPSGYYPPTAAVAAAAAQAAALTGTATEENNGAHPQVIPYLSGRHTWKRCAIHVFIARFIDLQQQVARHSLMAATLSYGGKPYNLNMSADAVYGNGGILPSASGMGSSVSSGLALGAMPERNVQQSKTGTYMDSLLRKHPVHQQQQQQHAQTPTFGFPLSQGLPSNTPGSAASTASNGNGSNTASVSGSGSSSVASIAAQAQFFQAVMQHNPFPFPFPTSHFGSHNFNGAQSLTQQAAQFVNNPFYASHLVQQQQSQSQKTQQQGGRVFSGMGSSQQQQLSPSAYASSLTGALQGEKDGREASDSKMLQRLMFAQQASSNGTPTPPVVLGPDGCQDFSSLGGKHVGKLQTGSVQQHSGIQQQPGQHANSMSLKGMETQASQVHGSSASSRGSVGPGPLGLAPVAAVMAPQGHAVLQGMADQGRMHPHGQTQTHLHAMQAGQQQPRSLRVDELYEGSNQSSVDERKLGTKRSAPGSRVELDSLPMQASPTGGSSSSRMANAAMNLLPAGSVSSRLQSGAPMQQQSVNQTVKQVAAAAAAAAAVRGKAPPATSGSPVAPFNDRSSLNRSSGNGMPFPAQSGMPTMQASAKQSQVVTQHPQLKLSQRPSGAALPGASVMAATMSKNQQVQPARSPQSSSPAPRIPPGGSPAPGSPSLPGSQASKQQQQQQQQQQNQRNANKAMFKPPVVLPGRRSPATPTMLNPLPQNQPSKSMQQQQQQQQQPQQQQQLPQQPLPSTSPQHSPHMSQQHHTSQKQQLQLRQNPMFLQQQYVQQQQQQLPQAPQLQLQGSSSPSPNGLLLGSQNLSLASGSSNGTPMKSGVLDNSFAPKPAARTSPGSPVTSIASTPQRMNGVQQQQQQHQTGSPSSMQQQATGFPVGYPGGGGGGGSLKTTEQKNDASPVLSAVPSTSSMSSPLKASVSSFSSQTPGRQPQQQQHQQQQPPATPGKTGTYADSSPMLPLVSRSPAASCTAAGVDNGASLASSSPALAAATAAAVSFVNSSGVIQQQQVGVAGGGGGGGSVLSPHQQPSSSSMPLVVAAAAAAASAPGLLGQSSASALRP